MNASLEAALTPGKSVILKKWLNLFVFDEFTQSGKNVLQSSYFKHEKNGAIKVVTSIYIWFLIQASSLYQKAEITEDKIRQNVLAE